MMSNEILAVVYGLLSAITWGTGDFTGGLASKRSNIYAVVVFSQVTGGILILVSAVTFSEAFPFASDLLLGGAAGIFGAGGLLAFYRGLAVGKMSVVAPTAAVVSASWPVLLGGILEGFPGGFQALGFVIAIFSIGIVSSGGLRESISIRDVGAGLISGTGFGVFFIFIDQVSPGAVFWPLVAARFASVTLLLGYALLSGKIRRPDISDTGAIMLAGTFDTGGNVFFVLAAQTGRLDISAVLSSLYAVMTVFLAWFLLKEKLSLFQWFGVVGAGFAIYLIVM